MKIAIRLALTALLLFFVYKETGPFTALSIALMTVGLEISTWHVGVIAKAIREGG